jgi:prepilin-type N-terminal cleavage/methylation domain-containing protein/prepilin-type processing-associated H-X9-DG protein
MKRAFTLIELLVVIGIIAMLIAILLPALSRANEASRSVKCLSNLRQMVVAAQIYLNDNQGLFPVASYTVVDPTFAISYSWDFTFIKNRVTGEKQVVPGLLWPKGNNQAIQQCPSFEGKNNSLGGDLERYTGYNYNKSYLGHGEGSNPTTPAKASQVRSSATCAIFGDGEYSSGANKYMRSPLYSLSDTFAARAAGTQGYRHHGKTNVAFVDGHAESRSECFSAGFVVAPRTGFLSKDNSLYDME